MPKEIFYKFHKGNIIPLTWTERQTVDEYMDKKKFAHGFVNVRKVMHNMVSFKKDNCDLQISLWNEGTCISLTYDEYIIIYKFIIHPDKLLAKLTAELV